MRATLRTRVAVVAAVAVAGTAVVVAAAAFFVAGRELRAEIDASLVERIRVVRRASEDLGPLMRERLPRPFFGPGPGPTFDTLYYQLVTDEGRVIVPPGQPFFLPVVVPAGDDEILDDVRVEGIHLRMIAARVQPFGVVQIARPLAEVDATLGRLAWVLGGVVALGSVAAGGVGLLLARSTLRPLDRLADAAERVAETQELDARIAVERADEVGRVAASLNAMLGALEESREQQRRLVRDAGHELRTPLTALRTNLELLARADDLPEDERRAMLDAARAEVEELGTLVAQVVDLAADRHGEEPVVELRLDDVVAEAVERARRRTGREILLDAADVLVEGRRGALLQAVGNLLDNAEKWSPDGAPVRVAVTPDGRVTVRDHGPGIPPREAERIFDRFYRTPEARGTPGSGLGLAIVQRIVVDHGGEVLVERAEDGGAVVGFRLPVSGGPQLSLTSS